MDARRRLSAQQGLLTTLAPVAVLLAVAVDTPGAFAGAVNELTSLAALWFGFAALLLLLAGLVIARIPTVAWNLARLGLVLVATGLLPGLLDDPGLGLAALLATGAVLVWGFGPLPVRQEGRRRTASRERGEHLVGGLWASGLVALGAGLLVGVRLEAVGVAAWACVVSAFGVSAIHSVRWVRAVLPLLPGPARLLLLLPVLLLGAGAATWRLPGLSLSLLATAQALVLALEFRFEKTLMERLVDVLANPARQMVITFALLGLVGGTLLTFPVSAARSPISFVDGLFTAVSASCVTGLTVLDTPRDFTAFGEVVILLLIQVGGLGIMTFSAAASLALGRRMGLRTEAAINDLLSEGRSTLPDALRRVLVLCFVTEGVGAVLLAGAFLAHGMGPGEALWKGVFTSISAFCNAGFALESDNLVSFQREPFVLHVVGVLIVLGGLGAPVMVALPEVLRGRKVSVHARLVLVTTALLVVGGAVALASVEWTHTLAGLHWTDRLHNAWFTSVTPRTAGFNSVDFAALSPAGFVLVMLLMFVGGSPGSTAGGIKTTTVALLALAVASTLRGRPEIQVFHRRIDHASVYKAAAVFTLGGVAALLAFLALALTQNIPPRLLAFETVSALGTVGLSMGATPRLDVVGRLIVIGCMFVGRVGPLSLFLFMATRRPPAAWTLPEESVAVG